MSRLIVFNLMSIDGFIAARKTDLQWTHFVSPVILAAGRSMFTGPGRRLNLTLSKSRTFGNGSVLLRYTAS